MAVTELTGSAQKFYRDMMTLAGTGQTEVFSAYSNEAIRLIAASVDRLNRERDGSAEGFFQQQHAAFEAIAKTGGTQSDPGAIGRQFQTLAQAETLIGSVDARRDEGGKGQTAYRTLTIFIADKAHEFNQANPGNAFSLDEMREKAAAELSNPQQPQPQNNNAVDPAQTNTGQPANIRAEGTERHASTTDTGQAQVSTKEFMVDAKKNLMELFDSQFKGKPPIEGRKEYEALVNGAIAEMSILHRSGNVDGAVELLNKKYQEEFKPQAELAGAMATSSSNAQAPRRSGLLGLTDMIRDNPAQLQAMAVALNVGNRIPGLGHISKAATLLAAADAQIAAFTGERGSVSKVIANWTEGVVTSAPAGKVVAGGARAAAPVVGTVATVMNTVINNKNVQALAGKVKMTPAMMASIQQAVEKAHTNIVEKGVEADRVTRAGKTPDQGQSNNRNV